MSSIPELDYHYLASPYSSSDNELVEERVRRTRHAKAWLRRTFSFVIYSPIVHWHETTKLHDMPSDAESWKLDNYTMQRNAKAGVIVLCLTGWRESKGVNLEIDWALVLAQPIWQLVPLAGHENDYILISVLGDPR